MKLKFFLLWLLLFNLPAFPQTIENDFGRLVDDEVFDRRLLESRVIYLGESHTAREHHQAQAQILSRLVALGVRPAIGLEMVAVDRQEVLDQFHRGEISLENLPRSLQWEERWGHSWELYRPLFEVAQSASLPLVALNAPREVTRKVREAGLGALFETVDEVLVGPAPYRQHLQEIYAHHGGSADGFVNFFLVQLTWDESMAAGVVNHLRSSRAPMVVVAGSGHVAHGYGIPSRVFRRFLVPQTTILFSESPYGEREDSCDFFYKL